MNYPDLSPAMVKFMLTLPCPTTSVVHGATLSALLNPDFSTYTGPRGLVYVDDSPLNGRRFEATLFGLGWLQGYREGRRAEVDQ